MLGGKLIRSHTSEVIQVVVFRNDKDAVLKHCVTLLSTVR